MKNWTTVQSLTNTRRRCNINPTAYFCQTLNDSTNISLLQTVNGT